MKTTHTLQSAEAEIVYDVRGPLPAADARPPLFMIGQPMRASGFDALAAQLPERTVVTYDPRGLGRSTRKDGRVDHAPTVQADDVHAVIEALGGGPVDMFASSGGAVTALALVAAYPDDVATLVAHEPPLIPVLPDAAAAERARAGVRDAVRGPGGECRYGGLHRDDVVARRVHRRVLRGARGGSGCSSGCRPRTTGPARILCYPTGPGPSAAIAPTSRRSPRRERASSLPWARSRGA